MSTLVTASRDRSAKVMQCTAKYQGASSMHCSATFTCPEIPGPRGRDLPSLDARRFSNQSATGKCYLYDSKHAEVDA